MFEQNQNPDTIMRKMIMQEMQRRQRSGDIYGGPEYVTQQRAFGDIARAGSGATGRPGGPLRERVPTGRVQPSMFDLYAQYQAMQSGKMQNKMNEVELRKGKQDIRKGKQDINIRSRDQQIKEENHKQDLLDKMQTREQQKATFQVALENAGLSNDVLKQSIESQKIRHQTLIDNYERSKAGLDENAKLDLMKTKVALKAIENDEKLLNTRTKIEQQAADFNLEHNAHLYSMQSIQDEQQKLDFEKEKLRHDLKMNIYAGQTEKAAKQYKDIQEREKKLQKIANEMKELTDNEGKSKLKMIHGIVSAMPSAVALFTPQLIGWFMNEWNKASDNPEARKKVIQYALKHKLHIKNPDAPEFAGLYTNENLRAKQLAAVYLTQQRQQEDNGAFSLANLDDILA